MLKHVIIIKNYKFKIFSGIIHLPVLMGLGFRKGI